MNTSQSVAIVFGGSGTIGQAIVKELKKYFTIVLIVSRSPSQGDII